MKGNTGSNGRKNIGKVLKRGSNDQKHPPLSGKKTSGAIPPGSNGKSTR